MPVKVKGYRELLRAFAKAPENTRKEARAAFRQVGDAVRRDAALRFSPIDQRTAANFRTVVRVRGVAVEQRLRKTTGERSDFGALQMTRALVPAVKAKEYETGVAFEEALHRVSHDFERDARHA